jgi:predicted flap endonuclease-1-like 5' DNA nuclease/flagellar basal body-associated protein FliL
MDANQASSNRNLWIALAALAIGLVIGLVVLGWWLFPVQWTDASPEDMLMDYQVDYLRAAIDSFALTFDSNAALQRYEELGEDGPAALATVQADPGASPTAVAAYSQLVTVGEQEGYVEEPAQQGLGNVAKILIALVLIALVAGLVVWLMFRGRGRGRGPGPAEEPAPVTDETPAALVQETPDEGVPVEEVPVEGAAVAGALVAGTLVEETPESGDTHPVRVPTGDTQPVVTTPVESPPPMWLPEEEQSDTGESGPGMAAAAGAAAVAAAVAASGEEEPGSDEPAGEDTVEALLEVAETQPLPGAGLAAGAGVLAAAAGMDDNGESGGPATIEELAGVDPELAAADAPQEQVVASEAELPGGAAAYRPAQMGYELAYIEGIGPAYAEKLAGIGITTPGELLEQGATPRGRQSLAEQTGISGRLILEWVNHVDLFRIKGVGSEYADLLEAAGVDTVVELAMRNPEHLFQAVLSVNESKQLVRKPPVLAQVQDWVAQAKVLPRKIYY